MSHRCCPWWLTYSFDNPLRKLFMDPYQVVRPYVRPGMKIADIGCGMGYFTIALADLAGPDGTVSAVDLQPQQLRAVGRRCRKAGVTDRVKLVQASEGSLNVTGPVDFALAFWMVHEVPDLAGFFGQVRDILTPGGKMLVCEPKMHVTRKNTGDELTAALGCGFHGRMLDAAGWTGWSFELSKT